MKTTLLAAIVLAFSTSHAFAVSLAVKMACKEDYFAHCSHHAVGTPGVRQCMRDVGPRLSTGCISALADAGMIKSKSITKKYQTRVAQKPAAKKQYAKASRTEKKFAQADRSRKIASKDKRDKVYAEKDNRKSFAKKERRSREAVRRIAYARD